jgi:hypothetical protein
MAVARHFSESYPDFRLISVSLVRYSDSKFVLLAFYRRNFPSRPAPFVAYEYSKDRRVVTELSELEGRKYRPKAYK